MFITDQSKRITKERDLSKSEATVVTIDLQNIEKQGSDTKKKYHSIFSNFSIINNKNKENNFNE